MARRQRARGPRARCPLRRIWNRCPHLRALLDAFVYIADTLQELHFRMVATWRARSNPSRGGARIGECLTSESMLRRGRCGRKELRRHVSPLSALNIDRTEVQDAAAAACVTAHRETLESFACALHPARRIARLDGMRARAEDAEQLPPKQHARHLDFAGWAFEHGGIARGSKCRRARPYWSSRARSTSRTSCWGVTAPKLRMPYAARCGSLARRLVLPLAAVVADRRRAALATAPWPSTPAAADRGVTCRRVAERLRELLARHAPQSERVGIISCR